MPQLATICAAATLVVASAISLAADPGPALATPSTSARVGAPTVVTRASAVHPRQGRDYRLLTTLRGSDARRVEAVTPGDKVLLGYSVRSGHLALLDPRTGHCHALPSMGAARLLSTDGPVWWFVHAAGRTRPSVVRLDRSTQRIHRFTLPEVPGRQYYRVLGVDGDTVWFSNGRDVDHTSPDRVSSVRFGHPGTVESQGRHAAPTLVDGMLAWIVRSSYGPDGEPEGPDVVASRAAAGGPVTRVPLPELCKALDRSNALLSNGSQLVVDTECSNRRGGTVGPASELRSQPTFVVDPAVGAIVELRVESDEAAHQLSARTVTFYGYSYDLATGRLLKLPDPQGLAGLPPVTGPGGHPLALWPRGNDRHDVLVVRLT